MSICSASAQNFSVEGVAGMNVSNLGGVGAKIGFHAGARFELAIPAITEGIYTNAGLLFSLKGYALDWGVVRSKSNAYYIDIPIHMGYKYSVTDNFAIFGEAGPYLGVGLFGKTNTNYDYNDEKESSNIFDMLNRIDVGVGLRAGVEIMKKYTVSIGYDWGLLDSYKHSDEDYSDYDDSEIDITPGMKHTNLTISLGYKF